MFTFSQNSMFTFFNFPSPLQNVRFLRHESHDAFSKKSARQQNQTIKKNLCLIPVTKLHGTQPERVHLSGVNLSHSMFRLIVSCF